MEILIPQLASSGLIIIYHTYGLLYCFNKTTNSMCNLWKHWQNSVFHSLQIVYNWSRIIVILSSERSGNEPTHSQWDMIFLSPPNKYAELYIFSWAEICWLVPNKLLYFSAHPINTQNYMFQWSGNPLTCFQQDIIFFSPPDKYAELYFSTEQKSAGPLPV